MTTNRPASKISCATATAIVVANMIGTGVFISLGFQIAGIPSGFAIVFLWVIGGLIALCGALAYGELAAALPRSGGEYHFLSGIFHPAVGFLAGWISATVGFAAPIALSAMAFATYLHGIFPAVPPLWAALALVWIVTLVHLRDARTGSAFQNVFTLLKVVLSLAFIAAGFAFARRQPVTFFPALSDAGLICSAPFAVSLVFVMYAYSGWNAATYITAEVRDPSKSVPRSLLAGTLVVMALYVGLNAVFLYSTPIDQMRNQVEIGLIAGRHIFGAVGGNIVGGIICLGLVSSVSSMVWVGPRVAMTMGEDLPALRWLAVKSRTERPVAAIGWQFAIVNVLILTATFEKVLLYIQFTLIFCSFLTVLGLIVLRIRRPDLPRPCRAWGYPVTPLVFLGFSVFMMYFTIRERPVESLAGIATLLAGLVVYAVSARGTSGPVGR